LKTSVRIAAVLMFVLFSIQVFAECHVTSAGISFGAYSASSKADHASTGTVTVTCDGSPPGVIVDIAIGRGVNSGTFGPRQMKRTGGTDLLEYNLYTPDSVSKVWGEGTEGTHIVKTPQGVYQNRPASLTINGRIYAGQDVRPGTYGDTLSLTIMW
jgi:spore coat protein U-like protein